MRQRIERKGKYSRVYNVNEVWPRIFERISKGQSLVTAAKSENMPYATAKDQLEAYPELKEGYQRAKDNRADYHAEELVAISDEMPPPDLDPVLLSAWTQRQKLRIDTRKWTAAKLRPKAWGDRTEVNITSTNISIVQALKDADERVKTLELDNVSDIQDNLDPDAESES